MTDKIKVCCVCGPTASGKTSVAVNIALASEGEVISADSMQIYREISVSTAKPTAEETMGVPHHLIGHISVTDDYSVARYVSEAKDAIQRVVAHGRFPIVAGGTGLYIDSLLNNITFNECTADLCLRDRLKAEAAEKGNGALLEQLAAFDPVTAARLHVNDLHRIIRAIEIYKLTGITMSKQIEDSRNKESEYNVCKIGLTFSDREVLYDRINLRVDEMLQNGLVEEAKMYYDNYKGLNTSSQAIGIKELFPYFDDLASLDECVENIKMETRRYAKRQLSWFKRDPNVNWFDMSDPSVQKKIINFVKNYW